MINDPMAAFLVAAGSGLMGTRGGGGFGRAGLMGLDAMQAAKRMQLLEAENARREAEQRLEQQKVEAALAEATRQRALREAWMKKVTGGRQAQQSAAQAAAAPVSLGPVDPNPQADVANIMRNANIVNDRAQAAQQANAPPYTYDEGLQAELLGIDPKATDRLKEMMVGWEQKAGTGYRNPRTGRLEFTPDPKEGTQMVDGRIVGIPGAVEEAARRAGAVKGAEAEASARWQPVQGYQGGAPGVIPGVSMRDLIAGGQQSGQNAPQAPIATPQGHPPMPGSPRASAPALGGGGRGFIQTGPSIEQTAQGAALTDRLKSSEADLANLRRAQMVAPMKISRLTQIDKLLEGHDGGKLSPLGKDIASAAKSVGWEIDPNLSNKEAAEMLVNPLALSLRSTAEGGGMPGAMSDRDREFLVASIPNISQSAAGRRLGVKMMVAIERRNMEVARMANAWAKQYGGLGGTNPAGRTFYDELSVWSEANPLFNGMR